jgi:hypothetical protein
VQALVRGYKAQVMGDSDRRVFIHCGGKECDRRLFPYFDDRKKVVFECTDRCGFRKEVRIDRFHAALRRATDQHRTGLVLGGDF